MKKFISLVLAVFCLWAMTACISWPPAGTNPNSEPEITLNIPELFSPDPDVVDDVMKIGILINHPAPIKDWQIQIQPNRRQGGQAGQQQAGQAGEAQAGEARQRQGGQAGEAQAGEARQRQGGQAGQRQGGRRGPFFVQDGKGPLAEWKWNGKGTSGEMAQSATDYLFRLTVTDNFGNTNTAEGIISVDVIVKREGDIYKIVVPSIVFPPSSADFSKLTDEEMRGNRRILNLIGNALNKFDDYQIAVEGHSNPLTPPSTPARTAEEKEDQALSVARAQAVVTYLVDNRNISRSRLTAVGKSCTQPVADYDDEDENWKNRRVEFVLAK